VAASALSTATSSRFGRIPGNGRARNATGTRATGRINVDARTATEWGTLRAFIQVDVNAFTGSYLDTGSTSGVSLDKAYIQWAGITAGRISSFFDFYATALNFGAGVMSSLGSDNGSVNVLAYTATFGNGFSATIGFEDRSSVVRPLEGATLAGQRMPSIVGNIRVDQGWGSAQLSGVVQQLNANLFNGTRVDTEYGYAIQAGVKFNLPMLAAGDALWLQAAYADGAVGRLGLANVTAMGPLDGTAFDAARIDGSLKRTKGWGVTAALLHYWTPSVRQAVFGNYTAVDYSARVFNAYGLNDFKIWTIGTNVIWSPVKAFDIGVEVLYQKLDPKGRVVVVPATGQTRGSEDIWEARIRFQRDF
jgi:Porin subfamily.